MSKNVNSTCISTRIDWIDKEDEGEKLDFKA